MAVQFFLKHDFIKELMATYGYGSLEESKNPAAKEYKGLIFTVDFVQEKGSYVAMGDVEIANGKPAGITGQLPRVPGTKKIMCPHPPPCDPPPPPPPPPSSDISSLGDFSVEFIIDKSNPASACY